MAYRNTAHQTPEEAIDQTATEFENYWQDKPVSYWMSRLREEVEELDSSLNNEHDDPPEWELVQIASIARNFIKRLRRK